MKKLIISAWLIFIGSLVYSQPVNLVPNPSFESHVGCPHGWPNTNYVVDIAVPWQSSFFLVPGFGFTEYFHPCGDTKYNVPSNGGGAFQYPRTDSAYAGFRALNIGGNWPNQRGYVQVKLDSALVAGRDYYVEFFVSLNDLNLLALTSIGAYLSVTRPTTPNDSAFNNLINATPQIINPPNNFLTDTASWEKISGTYTALGGEEYITIGNFSPDSLTDYQVLLVNSKNSFYYIDDVTVIDQTVIPSTGNGITKPNSHVKVFPNPSLGFANFEIEAQDIFGDAIIIVMDLTGKTVKVLNVALTPPETNIQIDINGLSTGVYLYRIESENAILGQGKLIIQ